MNPDHDGGPRPAVSAARILRHLRLVVWVALILSWLVMLLYAWSAFATIPSAERLQRSHMTAIPTLATVAWLVARSALELAVLLALLWPGSRRYYALRTASAALLLPVYFLMTAPLTLTMIEWVHRRWLAAVEFALIVVLLGALIAALVRAATARLRRPPTT